MSFFSIQCLRDNASGALTLKIKEMGQRIISDCGPFLNPICHMYDTQVLPTVFLVYAFRVYSRYNLGNSEFSSDYIRVFRVFGSILAPIQ